MTGFTSTDQNHPGSSKQVSVAGVDEEGLTQQRESVGGDEEEEGLPVAGFHHMTRKQQTPPADDKTRERKQNFRVSTNMKLLVWLLLSGGMLLLISGSLGEQVQVLVSVGSQAVLPCRCSSSSSGSPAIIWTKDGGTVWRKQRSGLQYWGSSWAQKGVQRVRCPHSQFLQGDLSLQIDGVTEQDGGVYTCRVEDRGWATRSIVTLRVITVSVCPDVPLWGTDVSLGCRVNPPPDGASFSWRLNGNPSGPLTRTPSDGTGSITVKARLRMSGNWTCQVKLGDLEGEASAALTVRGILQPPREDIRLYAAVGSAASLPCVFSPGLTPSEPLWEKLRPGSLFRPAVDPFAASFSSSSSLSRPVGDKSARLDPVGLEDAGWYRCSGTVEGQRLARNMKLVVAQIVQTKEKGSETLSCRLTDTSAVTRYDWVQVASDPNGTESVLSVLEGQTVRVGRESDQSRWTCRFYGEEGLLGNITHNVHLMGGLTGPGKSSGRSQNTAALVGLSLLLLVLLLVLVQMYKNHQRRRRILRYPALETIVHNVANERDEKERSRVNK